MSDRVVRKSRRARIDLVASYYYIIRHNPAAARRFRRAAESTFAVLARMPGIGARFDRVSHPRLNGLRSSQVTGFKNYIIYDLPKPDGIELIRVLHAARDAKTILETEEGP